VTNPINAIAKPNVFYWSGDGTVIAVDVLIVIPLFTSLEATLDRKISSAGYYRAS
jgi:hypothetical protein